LRPGSGRRPRDVTRKTSIPLSTCERYANARYRVLDRNEKIDARSAKRRDRNAHHAPGTVEQRAAAASRKDGRIALNVSLALDRAVSADDAARDRAAQRLAQR